MDMTRGCCVSTIEEAEAFIGEFIREVRRDPKGAMQRHSREYDLFLPWLWEEVINAGTHDAPSHPSHEANQLFMEAAWGLVQKGVLRPGPPKITSEDQGGDYGKGYTLTFAGVKWLESLSAEQAGESQPSLDASTV